MEFHLLQPRSIARERAVMEYVADSSLDENDFILHSYGLELCVVLLLLCFLCRALIFNISYPRLQEFL